MADDSDDYEDDVSAAGHDDDDPAAAAAAIDDSATTTATNAKEEETKKEQEEVIVPPSWRDNSSKHKVEEHARRYHLNPPDDMPKDFLPYTKEERSLLHMYDVVKNFEREVLRLKEKKARERIYSATTTTTTTTNNTGNNNNDGAEAASGGGDNATAGRKKKKRKKKIAAAAAVAEMDGSIDAMMSSSEEEEDNDDDDIHTMNDDDDDNNDSDQEEDAERRKLQKLEDAKEEEERMREELLRRNSDGMAGISQPLIKKQKFADNAGGGGGGDEDYDGLSLTTTRGGGGAVGEGSGPSLLSKMMMSKTPPHDFSEKLGFKSWKGTVLFPDEIALSESGETSEIPQWTPKLNHRPKNPNDGAFLVALEDFDISKAVNGEGPNTIAIKFHAPFDSKRFSFNITGPNGPDNDFESILFHFNPRPREKGGQIVVNDKQKGIWGRAVQLPLSEAPVIFGQTSSTIVVQINGDGFDVFVEGKHVARLEHRVELPSRSCSLYLQFPTCDDSRRAENWIVYKAWWGNKESLTKDDVSNVAGVNAFDSVHPKKLFINGLRKIRTDDQVELRTAEMERVFGKWGGPRGVQTVVPKHSRFAFVEFETEQQCDLALRKVLEGNNFPYQLNRARRTKHEALEMERQEKESGKFGKASSGDW